MKTVLAGYLLWPLAHIINFKFIPADLRILYVNWYVSAPLSELSRESWRPSPTLCSPHILRQETATDICCSKCMHSPNVIGTWC